MALKCYPEMASAWLDPEETHDKDVAESGIDAEEVPEAIEEGVWPSDSNLH